MVKKLFYSEQIQIIKEQKLWAAVIGNRTRNLSAGHPSDYTVTSPYTGLKKKRIYIYIRMTPRCGGHSIRTPGIGDITDDGQAGGNASRYSPLPLGRAAAGTRPPGNPRCGIHYSSNHRSAAFVSAVCAPPPASLLFPPQTTLPE